jgi:UDP-N-acetylglucosamine 4,6-dehydratase
VRIKPLIIWPRLVTYKFNVIYNMFLNKTLLITGGTGSFGNAVLQRFLNTNIGEIRIFSRDEKKQHDMRVELKNNKVKFYIGDVRDYDSINSALQGVDFVFHAAALKQVPSCEFYPVEAVKTNVLGTENVLNASINNKVKKVICLSTDKAVYPINAMGISKAMMEKIMVAKSRISGKTILIGTRYGNVMASRGSVIPLFLDQINNNESITITDPEMTRFMMTLNDAVELVLFAFENGNSGDIFVQKSPASTIGELARAMIKIYDSKVGVNIIGTRHAEKLYETLLAKEEVQVAEDLGNYFRVAADNRDLNYNKYFTEGSGSISEIDDYHSHNTKRLSESELISLLNSIGYSKANL